MSDPVRNFIKTDLTGLPYTDSVTSLTVASAAGMPDPATDGAFNLTIWNRNEGDAADDANREIVRVTAIAGNTLTVLRGQEGTTATAKTAGIPYKVIQAATRKQFDDLRWTPITANIVAADSPFDATGKHYILADTDNGDITINLPALSTITGSAKQLPVTVYKNDYSPNVIFIVPNGTDKINGMDRIVISGLQESLVLSPTTNGWVFESAGSQGDIQDSTLYLKQAVADTPPNGFSTIGVDATGRAYIKQDDGGKDEIATKAEVDAKAGFDSATVDFSSEANFSTGEGTLRKAGDVVIFQVGATTPGYSSSTDVDTSTGFLPVGFRPAQIVSNTFIYGRRVLLYPDGRVRFISDSVQTSASQFTITYHV